MVRAIGALTNTILRDKVEGNRSRGRTARQWLDNVKEFTPTRPSSNEMWREQGTMLPGQSVSVGLPPNGLINLWHSISDKQRQLWWPFPDCISHGWPR